MSLALRCLLVLALLLSPPCHAWKKPAHSLHKKLGPHARHLPHAVQGHLAKFHSVVEAGSLAASVFRRGAGLRRWPTSSTPTASTSRRGLRASSKPIAVLFYGLTRSLHLVHDDIQRNILDVLPPHDVFLHTYRLSSPLVNPRAGEVNVSVDDSQLQLLQPTGYVVEDQDAVDKMLPFERVAAGGNPWCDNPVTVQTKLWPNATLRNHLRALHSMRTAHDLMAAFSRAVGVSYEWVVVTRPDLRFLNKLQWDDVRGLRPKQYLVPGFGHFGGVNDCFFAGNKRTARTYCHRLGDIPRVLPLGERFAAWAMQQHHFLPVSTPLFFQRVRSTGLVAKYDRELPERVGGPADPPLSGD